MFSCLLLKWRFMLSLLVNLISHCHFFLNFNTLHVLCVNPFVYLFVLFVPVGLIFSPFAYLLYVNVKSFLCLFCLSLWGSYKLCIHFVL